MNRKLALLSFCISLMLLSVSVMAQPASVRTSLLKDFQNPPEAAKPWVFWYWMQEAVTKEAITADLEAMKANGIGGAYLMPIQGAANPPLMEPVVAQQSPLWWQMVQHSMNEAKRLGLKLAMHVSDGFALAGGPWITPELSMQKLTWSKLAINGGQQIDTLLPNPASYEGYYQEVGIFAYPLVTNGDISSFTVRPTVTTSNGTDGSFLINNEHKTNFQCDTPCWIQYAFENPFTCRSVVIRTKGNNYEAQRLTMEVSEDGKTYKKLVQFKAPRHGWQDVDADLTEAVAPITAKYFRFYYNKEGSEPGSEDLDAAKWKPRLKITGIELSGEPQIHQYEGKNASVWRISERTTSTQLPDTLCIDPAKMIDLSAMVTDDGRLQWKAPIGKWMILRMGHTSTGHTNATGGAAKGLECDKFNTEAITTQFNGWFGEIYKKTDSATAREVLKIFHVDSWECGSQNWSPVFRDEFKKCRGYDIYPYLPVMAGIPIKTADFSERVLYDVRRTVAEVVADTFYLTLGKLAHEKGCTFTAESIAPTMTSDGLLHYKNVDVPMGEFWLHSPTHDKPNDMFDAVSGAHIYGKNIVQAEGFTELKLMWDEYPGMLKTLQDRNYALGVNRLVYHVFMHNPWLNQQPGMTLNGVGLYFQRDQTWWKPGKEWVSYAQRCQAILQQGTPVADIAVFTGEEIPRRSMLPDRLLPTLPGLFGKEKAAAEIIRKANIGTPLRSMPKGVTASANMADPQDWTNALRGYAYDAINPDALIRLAKVVNGRIVLPGGASYGLLVIPGRNPMMPDSNSMTVATAKKLVQMVRDGATILINETPGKTPGLTGQDSVVRNALSFLTAGTTTGGAMTIRQSGKGKIITGAYTNETLDAIGIARDVNVTEMNGTYADHIAYTHRKVNNGEVYFIANQADTARFIHLSLRTAGKIPELWNAVDRTVTAVTKWKNISGRTELDLSLPSSGSVFVVLLTPSKKITQSSLPTKKHTPKVTTVDGEWSVHFSKGENQVVNIPFSKLSDWSQNADSFIKYYSGTATYQKTISYQATGKEVWLDLGMIKNIASVKVNGVDCGITWTPPYRVNITKALKKGSNELEIAITNTWANALIGDHITNKNLKWTNAPYRLEGEPLQPSGLLGPVTIQEL